MTRTHLAWWGWIQGSNSSLDWLPSRPQKSRKSSLTTKARDFCFLVKKKGHWFFGWETSHPTELYIQYIFNGLMSIDDSTIYRSAASGESMQFMIWRDSSHTSGGKKQGMLQNKCDIRWFVWPSRVTWNNGGIYDQAVEWMDLGEANASNPLWLKFPVPIVKAPL